MPDPEAPAVDATTDAPPVAPPADPPAEPSLATVQADLKAANDRAEAAEASRDAFGKDNKKLRDQRRKLRADAAGDDPPADAAPSGGDADLRALAISGNAKAELIAQGADPELADLAAAGLDMDLVEIVDGRIEGLAEAVTLLLKERPNLKLKTSATPGVVDGAPSGTETKAPDPMSMSRDQLSQMTDAEWDAFAQANPIVEVQMGDGPVMRMNISSTPNPAFGRVMAAQKRHAEVTKKLTGGG